MTNKTRARAAVISAVAVLIALVLVVSWWSFWDASTTTEFGGPGAGPVAAQDAQRGLAVDTSGIGPLALATGNAAAGSTFRLWGQVRLSEAVSERYAMSVACCDELGAVREQRVDERSEYSFDDLPAGRYWLRATMNGTDPSHALVHLATDARQDFTLARQRKLSVRVIDENDWEWKPEGALFHATRSTPGHEIDFALDGIRVVNAAGAGFQHSDEEVPSWLWLDWPPPLYASLVVERLVLETQLVTAETERIEFRLARADPRLRPGRLRFRLVDAKTRQVHEIALGFLMGRGFRASLGFGVCDQPIPPGPWVLRTFSFEHEQRLLPCRMAPGGELDLGDIPLYPAATIRGRVVDERGRPSSLGVRCAACDARGNTMPSGGVLTSAKMADDGSFELKSLERGFCRLSVHGTRELALGDCVRVVDVRERDAKDVMLTVRPGVALVVRPSGRETPESGGRVYDSERVLVTSFTMSPDWPERIELAPGVYEVESWLEQGGPVTRTPIRLERDPVAVDMP